MSARHVCTGGRGGEGEGGGGVYYDLCWQRSVARCFSWSKQLKAVQKQAKRERQHKHPCMKDRERQHTHTCISYSNINSCNNSNNILIITITP